MEVEEKLEEVEENKEEDVGCPGTFKQKIFPGYEFAFALNHDGTVYGAGYNSHYNLGVGSTTQNATLKKVTIPNNEKVVQIANHMSYHSLFLTATGGLYGCGHGASYSFGNSSTGDLSTLTKLTFWNDKKIERIGASYQTSYVLLKNKDFYTFGSGSSGQLGNGSTSDGTTPCKITLTCLENGDEVQNFTGGVSHSVVVTKFGRVFSSGSNGYGELGLGDTTNRSYFTLVPFFKRAKIRIIAVVAGYNCFTFFLTSRFKVYACGYNSYGSLGIGHSTHSYHPQQIQQLEKHQIMKITAGYRHAACIEKGGAIFLCGYNNSGQVGNGNKKNCYLPVRLETKLKFLDVVCGFHNTFFVESSGNCYNVGLSSYGDNFSGTGTHLVMQKAATIQIKFEEMELQGSKEIVELESRKYYQIVRQKLFPGHHFTFALTKNRCLYGAGYNSNYNIGVGNTTSNTSPKSVSFISNEKIVQIANHLSYHSLLLGERGSLFGCGSGANYAFGNSSTSNLSCLTKLTFWNGKPIEKIGVSYMSSYVLLQNKDLYVFGNNSSGKLGTGSTDDQKTPLKSVPPLEKEDHIVNFAGGCSHTVLISRFGNAFSSGSNSNGELGLKDNTVRQKFTPIKFFQESKIGVIAVVAGYNYFSFFLSDRFEVYGCGCNSHGVLGLGDTTHRNYPHKMKNLEGYKIVKMTAGQYHAGFMDNLNRIFLCGYNANYQLGDGTTTSSKVPLMLGSSGVSLSSSLKFVDVVCGMSNTQFVHENGFCYSVGGSSYGDNFYSTGNHSGINQMNSTIKVEVENQKIDWGEGIDGKAGKEFQELMASVLAKDKILPKITEYSVGFKSSSTVVKIPCYLAIKSPMLKKEIASKKFETKILDKYVEPAARIKVWLGGKEPKFTNSGVYRNCYFLAIDWELYDLAFFLMENLLRLFPKFSDILDILFDLGDNVDSGLALACWKIVKDKHQKIYEEEAKYLKGKVGDSYSKDVVIRMGSLVYENLQEHETHKDVANKLTPGFDLRKHHLEHISHCFTENATKDKAFETLDGKIIKTHRAILCKADYFENLLSGSYSESKDKFVLLDFDSKMFSIIVLFQYLKKIHFPSLSHVELILLGRLSDKFGLLDLYDLVTKAYEDRNKMYTSDEQELQKEIFDLKKGLVDQQLTNMALQFEIKLNEKDSTNSKQLKKK